MKRLSLILITGMLIISSSLFAQDKDHVLLGRLQDSELEKTEMKNYEKFFIPLGKVVEGKFSKLDSVEGKIERRIYKPKKGTTVLEVYKNYSMALSQMGAEVLFKGNGSSEVGSGLGGAYYSINPMMGLVYRNTLPWSFTVVEKSSKALLIAKLSKNNKEYYINLIIGNGSEPYTVYQLDIIEVEEMSQTALIVNNNDTDTKSASTAEPVQDANANQNTTKTVTSETTDMEASLFSIQIGYAGFAFSDAEMCGTKISSKTNDVRVGSMYGFRDFSGPYAKAGYYIADNFGFIADINVLSAEADLYTDATSYATTAELFMTKVGVTGRFIGEKYPVKLIFSSGMGFGSFKAYHTIKDNITQTAIYYEGDQSINLVFFQVEISIPLAYGIFVFSEYEYSKGWGDSFVMNANDHLGNYKEIKYHSPDYGGHAFRIGVGYEFIKK